VARDIDRDDWRTFRVDRIHAPAPTGARFVPRDPPDAAAFVANSVTTAPYRFRARVIVHAPLAVVAEQVTPTTGMLEAHGEDRCLLTTGADSLESIAFHLAALGAEFTILEPPELIASARELAGRLNRACAPG
jgi:predicted DNA-binding transcriptional regulator YafY